MSVHLRRLSGWALIIGTVVATAGYLAAFAMTTQFTGSLWMPLYSIALVGDIIILLGLPAILAGHAGRLPLLTLIGYVGIFVTMTALNVAEGLVEAYVKPYLATHGGIPDSAAGLDMFENVALLFLVIGLICLGIAVIRAKVFGWWVGALFIASPVAGFAGLSGGLALISDYLAFTALFAIGLHTIRRTVPAPSITSAIAPAPVHS